MGSSLRRVLPAACLGIGALPGLAAAGPIDLSANEQQVGPLGAAPGVAKPGPAACGGFADACSGAAVSLKAPLAFEYGLSAEAGIAGSNHGFGTEVGVGGWIKPVGSDATIAISIFHDQWNGKYGHN